MSMAKNNVDFIGFLYKLYLTILLTQNPRQTEKKMADASFGTVFIPKYKPETNL